MALLPFSLPRLMGLSMSSASLPWLLVTNPITNERRALDLCMVDLCLSLTFLICNRVVKRISRRLQWPLPFLSVSESCGNGIVLSPPVTHALSLYGLPVVESGGGVVAHFSNGALERWRTLLLYCRSLDWLQSHRPDPVRPESITRSDPTGNRPD
ncbi:hypothetical protein CRG98_026766 [Punica granatum]|uniref:Uncharacterized protein n=1 Tax=Punica granatum TaxID=22663 RepID=A0A2I0J9B1_PUNGR|nr:hypothetical protein CRG98_026766 [Punica granatum]